MRPPSSSKPRSPTTDAIQLQGRRTRRRRSCRARRPRQGWRRRGGDCCAGRGRTARKPRSRRRRAGAGAGEPAGSGWVPRRWIDRRGSPKVLAGAPASSRVPAAVAGDARPAGDRGVAGDLGRMPEKTPRACAGCLREGRNPTFSPPRVTVLRLQDAREPSGPAPAAGMITATGRRRCCSTCGTRVPRRRLSGSRGRAATATSERRCCRLPPPLMPTAACRLRPVRTTGSPSAGSLWTRACAG